MKVGDKVKLNFAGKTKGAVVHKLFTSTVYFKVDFEKDKGKIVKRKVNKLGTGKAAKKKAVKKEKKDKKA